MLIAVVISLSLAIVLLGGAVLVSTTGHAFVAGMVWLAAALAFVLPIVLMRALLRVRLPTLRLTLQEIIVLNAARPLHLPYASIRSAQLVDLSPDWPGKAIVIEMEGAYEGNQLRYRVHTIDLSMTAADPADVFDQIQRRVERSKKQTASEMSRNPRLSPPDHPNAPPRDSP